MEISIKISLTEYHLLMRMINHEENDLSYLKSLGKQAEGIVEREGSVLSIFKKKANDAYRESCRRGDEINKMA